MPDIPRHMCILLQVDPMFQRMAASFDENSTAGVFLSVLFSEDSCCELKFPSHMTLLRSRPPGSPSPVQHTPASPFTGTALNTCPSVYVKSEQRDRPHWGIVVFVPAVSLKTLEEKMPICPSLEEFSFTQWTPEQVHKHIKGKFHPSCGPNMLLK